MLCSGCPKLLVSILAGCAFICTLACLVLSGSELGASRRLRSSQSIPDANSTSAALSEQAVNTSRELPVNLTAPILEFPVFFSNRRDVVGIESCHGEKTGYCNQMFDKARGACGNSRCVLIVNPPCCRTRTPLHVHAYHYNGRGSSLKHRLSDKVCGSKGWQSGGFPCHGKAKHFHGFPDVVSVAKQAGSIDQASIVAFPDSCGSGTIVLVSFHCSIEKDISQR